MLKDWERIKKKIYKILDNIEEISQEIPIVQCSAMSELEYEQIRNPCYFEALFCSTRTHFLWTERVNIANISSKSTTEKRNIMLETLCMDGEAIILGTLK